ncbi:MAG: M1 family metallopeptidase [Proteobacteria bacterium]|nr:M1 family metallopeptidase [Pseudomonadota bacterium]
MAQIAGRAAMLAVSSLIVALIAGVAAAAEPPYAFATTPGKLPKTVVPTHYAIELRPDLETSDLAGSEVVDVDVLQPTDRLVLNAVNIRFDAVALDGEDGQIATVALDPAAQTATLTFPRPLDAGRHKLRIGFAARINSFGRGLFAVDYPTDHGRKRMIASHLEPADARRIFPCWDEPAFKASFELAVTLPRALVAVSNMPVAREEPVGSDLKRVAFQATPKMSSYLFVLAAGELERLTGEADGVTIGVVTTSGKRAHGQYALASAIDLLKYYNDYFDVKYPLPKLDLIAVPGGYSGAMENWGGIIFFESRLLFDPASSPPGERRRIFSILAHEMAHQWFGDLVTMAWWDDLWLNEGFATWMQVKAAEQLHPDWQTWLNDSGGKQWAMSEDARRTSHPIQLPVADESEAMAVFDGITYSKGQAFIRMLESYLGEETFRAGLRQYMQDHAYSNATTTDLWLALQAASGEPVTATAAGYTEQAGVPLVVSEAICVGGRQRVVLRQDRFTIHDPDARPQRWQVPIVFGPLDAAQPAEFALLDGTAEVAAGRCGEPVKLNRGDVGYYRVQYDAATHAALAKSIALMAPADRVNLLADSWALVEAGRIAPARLFELIDAVGNEDSRAVWEQAIRALTRLDELERGRPERPAFQAYARARLRPAFDRLGWDPPPAEPDDPAFLRSRLIRVLGDLGDPEILAEAKRRFAAFQNDPASLPPSLRDVVTRLAGRTADRATYDALRALGRQTTSTEERVRLYFAAAGALDPALAEATLRIALTDELPTNLVGGLISQVAWAGEHPELAWAFVRENFAALAVKQGPAFRDYFVANLMTSFSDRVRAAELASFAPAHATSGGRMVAARAEEIILAAADFRAQFLPAVDDWVKDRQARP